VGGCITKGGVRLLQKGGKKKRIKTVRLLLGPKTRVSCKRMPKPCIRTGKKSSVGEKCRGMEIRFRDVMTAWKSENARGHPVRDDGTIGISEEKVAVNFGAGRTKMEERVAG